MGSVYCQVNFEASDKATLVENFKEYQSKKRYERGNGSYCGHLGKHALEVSSMSFKTEQAAVDWVQEHTDKYGPAVAVRVGDFSKVFPYTEAEKKLVAKQKEIQTSINSFEPNIISRVKASKSATKSCDHCGSKVSVKFVKTIDCPVCGHSSFLKTATDTKQEVALREKLKDINEKVNNAKKKYEKAANSNFWVVGGWAPS